MDSAFLLDMQTLPNDGVTEREERIARLTGDLNKEIDHSLVP